MGGAQGHVQPTGRHPALRGIVRECKQPLYLRRETDFVKLSFSFGPIEHNCRVDPVKSTATVGMHMSPATIRSVLGLFGVRQMRALLKSYMK
jgi:hypothetical protein